VKNDPVYRYNVFLYLQFFFINFL